MVSRRKLVIGVGATAIAGALGYAGYRAVTPSTPGEVTVRVFLNWFFTSSFAGDVLAADRYASDHGLRLNLEVGGEGRDPLKLVRDGDIGVASADEVIRAIDKGADVRIIGVLNDTHPAAFISLASSGIRTPKDFEGRRVGILPFGATGLIYQAMIENAGVDRSKIQEVVVSPDLRPFIAGTVNDVQPVFQYDEPVSLEKQNISFNLIDPRQFGVDFKGQCYFASTSTIKQQPDGLVRALAALAAGWEHAARAPQDAVDALRARSPSLTIDEELPRLRKALPFFVPASPQPLLGTDPATWDSMMKVLVSTNTISRPIPISEVLDMSLVKRAHDRRVS